MSGPFLKSKANELSNYFLELAKEEKGNALFESQKSAAIRLLATIYGQLIGENDLISFKPQIDHLREKTPDGQSYIRPIEIETDEIKKLYSNIIERYILQQFDKNVEVLPANEDNNKLKKKIKDYLDNFMIEFKKDLLEIKQDNSPDAKQWQFENPSATML